MAKFAAILVAFLAAPLASWAQVTVTSGVEIDAAGVLRCGDKIDPRLADIRKEATKGPKEDRIIYISLPRLFAEAKKAMDAGLPVPDGVKYLGGMVKLQYVFVYPDEKDIVIAGRAEAFDTDDTYRPLGKTTGRPVLHLDDLVVALRACGPGGKAPFLGCTLEVTTEMANNISKRTKELAPKVQAEVITERRASELIAEAAGPQPVKYFGVADNRFAVVCIEADYQLKQMEMGVLKSPISKVKSYMEMSGPPAKPHRFAFECAYDELAVSPDGNAFELRGPSLKVVTSLFSLEQMAAVEGEVVPAAKNFAGQVSKHFDELSRHMVSFADLANLSDIAVVSALIGRDSLHTKAGWDLAWVLEGYKVAAMTAPKTAATLCNYRKSSQQTIFVTGGVGLLPAVGLENRKKDEKGVTLAQCQRPEGDSWTTTRKITK